MCTLEAELAEAQASIKIIEDHLTTKFCAGSRATGKEVQNIF